MWEQIVRDAASGAAVSVRKRDLKKENKRKQKNSPVEESRQNNIFCFWNQTGGKSG